jgi:hypothetical protein
MITANYPAARRIIHMIMKTAPVCPIFGGGFSPGDEVSAQVTAKSPSGESPRDHDGRLPLFALAVI